MDVEGQINAMILLEQEGHIKPEELATLALTLLTYVLSIYEPGPGVDRWLNSIPNQLKAGLAISRTDAHFTHQSSNAIN